MSDLKLESQAAVRKIYNKELSDSEEKDHIEEQGFIEKPIKTTSSAPDLFHKFEIQPAVEDKSQIKRCLKCLRPFKGYFYGLIYVLGICITNIVKHI